METVFDALKAMGKASYREVAARLKVEPVEALKMLREQKEQGLCDFSNGGWFVDVTLYRERNPYNGMTTGWRELTEQEYEFVKDNAS